MSKLIEKLSNYVSRAYKGRVRKQERRGTEKNRSEPDAADDLLDSVQEELREWGGPFAFQFDHHYMDSDPICR